MQEKHILVVDDETEIVELVTSSLESKFNVTGLSDPTKVMAEFSACHYALVILDINLGSKSGYELCQELKSVCPETPVEFLSSLNG